MRIAFIVDGRAEHARHFVNHFSNGDHEILVISTYPCHWDTPPANYYQLPGIFRPGQAFAKMANTNEEDVGSFMKLAVRQGLDNLLRPAWHRLMALDSIWQGRAARRPLSEFRPDLVHALRIQNEGVVGAIAGNHPLIMSVWGQDLAYYARYYGTHRWFTRWAMPRTDGLTADCQRDIQMGHRLGLSKGTPTAVFPTNGGVDTQFYQAGVPVAERQHRILYARGFGPYLRLENLLRGFRDLSEAGVLTLIAPAVQIARFQRLVRSLRIDAGRVEMVSFLDKPMWRNYLRTARVLVSPSVSDGTPNSLLEAMACGTLPVFGNLDSIREWIDDGVNGLLCDPDDPDSIRHALERAMRDDTLFESAMRSNRHIIESRASVREVIPRVRCFYDTVIASYHDHHHYRTAHA